MQCVISFPCSSPQPQCVTSSFYPKCHPPPPLPLPLANFCRRPPERTGGAVAAPRDAPLFFPPTPPPRGRGRGPRRSCCSSSPSWPESAERAAAILAAPSPAAAGGAGGEEGRRRPGRQGGWGGREEEEANPKGGILHPAGGGGGAAGRPGSPWQDLSVRGRTLLHRGRVPVPPLLRASLSPSSGRLSLSPPLTFFKLSGEWKMVGCSLLLLLFARSRLCGVLFLPSLRGGLLLRRRGGGGRGERHEAGEAQEERNCDTKTSREAELFFNPIHPARPQHRSPGSLRRRPPCLPACLRRAPDTPPRAPPPAPARPGPARRRRPEGEGREPGPRDPGRFLKAGRQRGTASRSQAREGRGGGSQEGGLGGFS